jgi:hypothetical protein
MQNLKLKTAAALTTAAAIAVSVSVASAAPVGTRAAQLEQATPGQIVDVQWRRWRRAAPWIIGGAIIGGALASRHYYDGRYYYYDDDDYPSAYYAYPQGPGPRTCWVPTTPDGTHGYWQAC